MATFALSRNANRLLRNTTRRLITLRYLTNQSIKSSSLFPSSSPSPLLHNPNLAFLLPRSVSSLPIYQTSFFTTAATTTTTPPPPAASTSATVYNTESSSKTEDAKTKGSEKTGDSKQESSDSTKNTNAGKPIRGGPVSWLSFLLLCATGAGILWYYDKEKKRHIEEINKTSMAVKEGPSVGKAEIGGPFNLIDHDGKPVTENDFKGKWTMIYFGFTHCPDICPDELQKLAAAIDKIKEKAGLDIVPVFITVDPERDNVEQVREYVKEFHPKLIGLTGSPEEIKKTARAYRIYFMKTSEEDSDYLVDHSIITYLMDPNMELVKFFGKNNDVDSLAEGVIKEIKQYKTRTRKV